MANILKLKECEDCGGRGFQIKSDAPMKGYVRPCQSCTGNYKKFSNQYGTLKGDGPAVYIERKGRVPVLHKLKPGQKTLELNGKLLSFK